ncbi:MAG: Gfo/Idh/MocA family oxidoreductase [Acidobacteria bacterium]|nr:Gfo/Idh/MocA family oxidoreductase [Acidobacteriota bacterium]
MERRSFFLSSGGALLAQAPSRQIVIGLIGAGGRGRYIMQTAMRDPGVRVAGVADVYEPNLEAGLSAAGAAPAGAARGYRNYRALLENRDIDAVIIGSPEHWHHRMLLDALAAGKDVYVEKPLCQTPEQGVELVEAARRSKSVVQVGTQRRSYDLYLKAREAVRAGALGSVRMVRCWWLNNMLQPPAGQLKGPLDWDQWQGPAKRVGPQPDPARFFHWRSFSEYSGGIMADQGAHVFDGVHMLMNAGYPAAVTAAAGRIHRPGVDTPDVVTVTAEYPQDFVATFSINYAAMRYKTVNDQLNQFDGDKARLDIGREQFAIYNQGAEETPVSRFASGGMSRASEDHVRNFLECIRTRATPAATVESGFQAGLVTQMANISLREGRRVRWNAERKKVEG